MHIVVGGNFIHKKKKFPYRKHGRDTVRRRISPVIVESISGDAKKKKKENSAHDARGKLPNAELLTGGRAAAARLVVVFGKR